MPKANNPLFIAEVCSNHQGSLERSLSFVDTAAKIGCDVIKFQLFKIDELFAPEIVRARKEVQARRAWELPVSFLEPLAKRAREKKIQFSCTPFYLEAVDELFPHVDFYKIASYELLWKELLVACARTGKPVIISTGMATEDEVASAIGTLREAGCRDITALHCVSVYPCPTRDCNLAAIETMRRRFNVKTGWSDHSHSDGVIARAVHRHGAEVIEAHIDLDGNGAEHHMGHSWLPHELERTIAQIRLGISADGSGVKEPAPSESDERNWRADPSDGLRPLLPTRRQFKP